MEQLEGKKESSPSKLLLQNNFTPFSLVATEVWHVMDDVVETTRACGIMYDAIIYEREINRTKKMCARYVLKQ